MIQFYKEKKMKKFLIALNIIVWSIVCAEVAYSAETKQVCHDVKNAKTGKVVNQCKTIKVHKMFEGTKVPTPAPKAPAAKKPAAKPAKK